MPLMRIALDYDGTYTRDPDFFDAVILLAVQRGHDVICVTNRAWIPGSLQPERVPPIPMIAAADEHKRAAAIAAGFTVDVWVDDFPGTIEPPATLP